MIYNNYLLFILFITVSGESKPIAQNIDENDTVVRVNKCCEKFEIRIGSSCTNASENYSDAWKPSFTSYNGQPVEDIKYKFIIGIPACGSMQVWPIYDYVGSSDKLVLLEDGKLRHYTRSGKEDEIDEEQRDYGNGPRFYDYTFGQYCLEKGFAESGAARRDFMFAKICLPEKKLNWTDTDFIFRKIMNPLFHATSIVIFLIVSIIYFILPSLRDLVGNIITTITICLMISQAADLVKIFTEFSNHVSFLVADTILYISLLSAFFWLNSFGYYIWKTFRSRNVFLRVTDSRKYCWYSGFAWGCTGIMAALVIFSHYFLDTSTSKEDRFTAQQETIGRLGIGVFLSVILVTILANVFFYVTTTNLINRRNLYGRIQHKLRANFYMYTFLCLVMSINWVFLILSLYNYNGLLYTHVLVNAIQAPLILYICVFKQRHVTFLLKKSCCYNEPQTITDWGNEMNYIGGNN